MSVFVVDACVAAKWFFDEVHDGAARALLDAGNRLHAPDLVLLEMDSFLCKRARRGQISEQDARDARRTLRRMQLQLHPFGDLLDTAFDVAMATRRAVYDSVYLALAAALAAPMVTADRRLYDALQATPFARQVVWVTDV